MENKIEIVEFIKQNQGISSKEIHENISTSISYATVKRILTNLVAENLLSVKGKGKGTKYSISPVLITSIR